jgi:hypothetical protein
MYMKNFTPEEFTSLVTKFKEKQVPQKSIDLKALFEKARGQLRERCAQAVAARPVEIQKPALPTDTTVVPSIFKELKERMASNENE